MGALYACALLRLRVTKGKFTLSWREFGGSLIGPLGLHYMNMLDVGSQKLYGKCLKKCLQDVFSY